jgi:phosphate-selective porin OprO/OprP
MIIAKLLSPAPVAGLIAFLLLSSPGLRAQADSESERLGKLERAVDQLQKRNAELEDEVRGLKKRLAAGAEVDANGNQKAKTVSDGKTLLEKPITDEKPPVFVVQGGPEIKLTLGGFIQANFEGGDVSAFEGRFGQTALKDRFRLRRARINLTGEFAEQFDFKMEGDFENSDGLNSNRTAFEATDIWANWHRYPEAQIKVGQYKAPFGLEQLTPDTQLFVIERGLPTGAITPERQIGVELWGQPFTNVWPEQKDLLTYHVGIFNGNGRNTTLNDNNNFMSVARLELMPFKGKIFGQDASLKLGGDFLNSRDDAGTNISQSLTLKVNSDGSLSPYTLPGADERNAWSFDAWLNIGPFDLIGEYLAEDVDGRTVAGHPPGFSDFDPSGWYIQASYFILPKKLQGVVKWEALEPDQVDDDNIHSLVLGVNYYIHGDTIKLMAEYIHTWSRFREARPQFGDDNFDEVLMRLQVMF